MSETQERTRHIDEARDEALAMLEEGVEAVLTSDEFRHYLEFLSNFHKYSWGNVLLIMAQKPEASMVAGFRRWKKLGRHVKRGERGITIITPRLVKEKDPETGEEYEKLVGFGTGRVFDISQTEGVPIPEPPRARELRESSSAGKAVAEAVKDYLASIGVPAFAASFHDGRMGEYDAGNKVVRYRMDVSADQMAKTLTHEAAHHIVCTSKWGENILRRGDHETIAEGASFVVLNRYGVDTADYSFAYIATWAGDMERVRENLHAIQKTASALISGIERNGRGDVQKA